MRSVELTNYRYFCMLCPHPIYVYGLGYFINLALVNKNFAYTALPDSLVVKAYLPSAIAASHLRRLHFPQYPQYLSPQSSFIHIEHLYSASSRKLLRSAPNTSTVKQSSLKVRKKTQVEWFC